MPFVLIIICIHYLKTLHNQNILDYCNPCNNTALAAYAFSIDHLLAMMIHSVLLIK